MINMFDLNGKNRVGVIKTFSCLLGIIIVGGVCCGCSYEEKPEAASIVSGGFPVLYINGNTYQISVENGIDNFEQIEDGVVTVRDMTLDGDDVDVHFTYYDMDGNPQDFAADGRSEEDYHGDIADFDLLDPDGFKSGEEINAYISGIWGYNLDGTDSHPLVLNIHVNGLPFDSTGMDNDQIRDYLNNNYMYIDSWQGSDEYWSIVCNGTGVIDCSSEGFIGAYNSYVNYLLNGGGMITPVFTEESEEEYRQMLLDSDWYKCSFIFTMLRNDIAYPSDDFFANNESARAAYATADMIQPTGQSDMWVELMIYEDEDGFSTNIQFIVPEDTGRSLFYSWYSNWIPGIDPESFNQLRNWRGEYGW